MPAKRSPQNARTTWCRSSDVLAALRTVLRAEGAPSGRDSARARRRLLRGLRRRCGDDRAPAVDRADLEGRRRRARRDGRGAASRARRLLGQTRRAPANRRTGGADGGAGPQPAHAARRGPHRHAGDVDRGAPARSHPQQLSRRRRGRRRRDRRRARRRLDGTLRGDRVRRAERASTRPSPRSRGWSRSRSSPTRRRRYATPSPGPRPRCA